jgi:hypothetical protein
MRSVLDVRMDTQVVCIIASKIVACFFLCGRYHFTHWMLLMYFQILWVQSESEIESV